MSSIDAVVHLEIEQDLSLCWPMPHHQRLEIVWHEPDRGRGVLMGGFTGDRVDATTGSWLRLQTAQHRGLAGEGFHELAVPHAGDRHHRAG